MSSGFAPNYAWTGPPTQYNGTGVNGGDSGKMPAELKPSRAALATQLSYKSHMQTVFLDNSNIQ